MDLVNRYLQAVKFWLPNKQKQDIIAELSEDIRSQIEDRETELGRKLKDEGLWDSEVSAMIDVSYDRQGTTPLPRGRTHLLIDAIPIPPTPTLFDELS